MSAAASEVLSSCKTNDQPWVLHKLFTLRISLVCYIHFIRNQRVPRGDVLAACLSASGYAVGVVLGTMGLIETLPGRFVSQIRDEIKVDLIEYVSLRFS